MFWALYTVLIRWWRTQLPLNLFLTVTIFFGVLIHLPFVAVEAMTVGGFTPTMGSMAAIVYFALFPSLAAYVLWNRAVAALGPGRTGMFMYLMPAFSAALGVGFLNEAFRLYHAVGIALIFAGITLVTRRPKAKA
jgi:drug/metabolite transporter (DMT)-like permease